MEAKEGLTMDQHMAIYNSCQGLWGGKEDVDMDEHHVRDEACKRYLKSKSQENNGSQNGIASHGSAESHEGMAMAM
jgi:hypothetical protein